MEAEERPSLRLILFRGERWASGSERGALARPGSVRWILAAGLTLTIVAAWWGLRQATPHVRATTARQLVALIETPQDRSEIRGGSWYRRSPERRDRDLPQSASVLQAGVQAVDLEISVKLQDHARARMAIVELIGLARQQRLHELAVVYLRLLWTLQDEPSERDLRRQIRTAERALAETADSPFFLVGEWSEASRLAARFRQPAFFAQRTYRALLAEADRTVLQTEARHCLTGIEQATSREVSVEALGDLEDLFERLLQASLDGSAGGPQSERRAARISNNSATTRAMPSISAPSTTSSTWSGSTSIPGSRLARLPPQGVHGIDPCRPPRRDVAGQGGDADEQQ